MYSDSVAREECTKARPMPAVRDQMGQRWAHVDAVETDYDGDYSIEYRCPNCGLVFRCEMPD